MMDNKNYNGDEIANCLKLWRERILNSKRKDLTTGDLTSMFQQRDLQGAFFKLIDRDANGALSIEEWTGCFSKLLGDRDANSLCWFVEKFNDYININDKIYLDETDFNQIVSDVEFGYRFGAIISPKSRRINSLQLITSLEIIGSLSTDAKWLSWLKYQFTAAIKKKPNYIEQISIDPNNNTNKEGLYVTLEDFKENFYFKEPFLAARLFEYLDKDKSGTLTLHEFINGLEVVVNGNTDEKIEFLFKVFDVDNDGSIDFDEMRMMLKCCLADSPSLDMNETIEDLTAILFKAHDRDSSGNISLDELRHAFAKHDSIFKTLTVSTSIWIKPKFISKSSNKGIVNKCKIAFQNRTPTLVFWSFYTLITLACMITAYLNYATSSYYVICARIFGNALNFNCSLILVLVLRKHFTWLRIKGGASILPLDDFIDIHKRVGVIILVMSSIHTIAHLINLYIVCDNPDPSQVKSYFTMLFTHELNIGYPTGVILAVLFLIICVFALPFVRKQGYFQLFYFFHMCTIPWLIIMLLHGRKFWIWILLPLFCYLIEKILKYRKTSSNKFGDTIITEAFVLPSKVTHLVIRKPAKFYFKPGDYVFINIPAIAKYEWHPFSISSAPENSKFIWLHIKALGHWTNKLYSYSMSSKFEISLTQQQEAGSGVCQSPIFNRANMRKRMSRSLIDFPMLFDKKKHVDALNNHRKQSEHQENHHVLDKECTVQSVAKNKKMIMSLHGKKIVSFSDNINEQVTTGANVDVGTSLGNSGTAISAPQQSQSQNADKWFRALSYDNTKNVSLKEEEEVEPQENKRKNNSYHEIPETNAKPNESTPKFNNNSNKSPISMASKYQSVLSLNHNEDYLDSKTTTTKSKQKKSRRSTSLDSLSRKKLNQDAENSKSKNKVTEFKKSQSEDNPDFYRIHNNSKLNTSQSSRIFNLGSVKNVIFSAKSKALNISNNNTSNTSFKDKVLNNSLLNNIKSLKNKSPILTNGNGDDDELHQTLLDNADNEKNDISEKRNESGEQILPQSKMLKQSPPPPPLSSSSSKKSQIVSNTRNHVQIQLNDDLNDEDGETDELGYLKMYQHTNYINMNTIGIERLWRLKVFIDGPYGTPSMEIFDAEHAVLVAAGIGITPFASILQSLMFRYRQARATCPNCDHKLSEKLINQQDKLSVRRVDFIWITREQRSLEWFISILSQMEIEQRKNNESFLETHLYVTSAKRQSDLKTISLQYTIDCLFSEEESHLVEGLRKRTNYGRPNWDIVMQNLIRKQQGKISLFYCGPPALANTLQSKCKQYNFTFKKEVF